MEPQPLKRIVVKEELVKLTGDFFGALILNQFLYWSQRVRDFDEFLAEEQARDPEKEINVEATSGWIYKSRAEFHDELMLGQTISVKTLGRKLKDIEDKGFLASRSNPSAKWDKTKQYRPNISLIQRELNKLGYCLEGYPLSIESQDNPLNSFKGHSVPSKGHHDSSRGHHVSSEGHSVLSIGHHVPSKAHGDPAIPEIITETTTETTQKKDARVCDENLFEVVSRVVGHLNSTTKSDFNPSTPATIELIKARISEGYTEQDLIGVINAKSNKWLSDLNKAQYLRPKTLFSLENFESYLQEAIRQGQRPKTLQSGQVHNESKQDRVNRMNYAVSLYRTDRREGSEYQTYIKQFNFSPQEIETVEKAASGKN